MVTLVTLSELSSQPSQLINLAVRSSGAEQGGKEASKMIAESWDGQFSEGRPCVPVWLVLTVLYSQIVFIRSHYITGQLVRPGPPSLQPLFRASAQSSDHSGWLSLLVLRSVQCGVWRMFAAPDVMTSLGVPCSPALPSAVRSSAAERHLVTVCRPIMPRLFLEFSLTSHTSHLCPATTC